MRRRRCLIWTLYLAAATVVIAPWLTFVSADAQTASQSRRQSSLFSSLFVRSVFSDFDGDNKADVAELTSGGQYKHIRLSLSGSWGGVISFNSETGAEGKLFSADIDQDNDQDLLWISQESSRKILCWLGDGRGKFVHVRDFRPDPRQLGQLLGAESPGVSENQTTCVRTCALLPGGLYSLPHSDRSKLAIYTASLPSHGSLLPISAGCRTILCKRGPPSELS